MPLHRLHPDRWLTPALLLLCGLLTFILVREEYGAGESPLHRLPVRLVWERVLRNENSSSLAVTWKDEAAGALLLRVTPGLRPHLNGAARLQIPILGENHPVQLDLDCILTPRRDLERLRLHVTSRDITLEVTADKARDLVTCSVRGPGGRETRQIPWRSLRSKQGRDLLRRQSPELARLLPPALLAETGGGASALRVTATTTRIRRRDDWMEVDLIHARLDANNWAKLWISLTGEILQFDSSFGLRARNEDFFDGLAPDRAPPSPLQKP